MSESNLNTETWTPTPTPEQNPKQALRERLAEASPLMEFPRMVETIHLNRQRKNYRRQLEYDRAAQAAILRGDKPPAWEMRDEQDGEEEMGDSFSISGDTNHYHTITPQPQQQTSKISDLVKGGLLAAAIASGPAGAGLGYWLSQQKPPAAIPATTQQQPQEKTAATPTQQVPWYLYPKYEVHPPE